MDVTIVAARILFVFYISIGIAGIVNKKYYMNLVDALFKNKAMSFLMGFMIVTLCMILIHVHNVWSGWPALITVLAYLGLIKGVMFIAFEDALAEISRGIFSGKVGSFLPMLVLVFGVVFGYVGFLW